MFETKANVLSACDGDPLFKSKTIIKQLIDAKSKDEPVNPRVEYEDDGC
ncbi:MAG: hypothetical protein WBG65_09960 [Sulfurimonadaceae bacterium]